MRVVIENLSKRFGQTLVLNSVSFAVEDHELFFLLGPSGCGKTTLLRGVAGFISPDSGRVQFGDRLMNGIPPHQRNAGMVFQNYALWPHLTVSENVAYGLEVRGMKDQDKRQRVAEALAIVQMEPYAERAPNQLSGGQQQRVALARALVIRPDVLLLDEPLSNLDAKLRLEMREEIRRIQAQTRITTLYVTHDQKESLSLADRIAVMHAGAIQQIGEPRAVYRSPANRFVADFMAETNWLTARVQANSPSELLLECEFGPLHAKPHPGFLPGNQVRVGFRPESVQVGTHETNGFSTKVAQISYLGETEQYTLRLSPRVTLKAIELDPQEIRRPGQMLPVHVAPHNLLVFPETE